MLVTHGKLATLLSLASVMLGMATPAFSQAEKQLAPLIIPVSPPSSQPGNVLAQTSIIPKSLNLDQLITKWGFTLVACRAGVISIKLDMNTVCVSFTPQLI